MARPSENRWETHHYREASKKRSLHEVEINNRYIYDPDATFPDDTIRGERDPRIRDQRNIYGDNVKVCNTHPDRDHDGSNADDPRSAQTGNGAPTHTTSRYVEWLRIYRPETYAEVYSRCSACIHARPASVYIRSKLRETLLETGPPSV